MAAATNVLRRVPYDYGVADPDDFMTSYRYSLTNVIEAEQAIPWLRDNCVLDADDQEIILHGHKTSVLRAGHLIDTVLKRGPNGFNVLMEFIEYEYPELYAKMMSKPAREPDHSVYTPKRNRSVRLSEAFREAFDKFNKAKDASISSQQRAERKLEAKIGDIQAELLMREGQILDLTQNTMELTARNKELSEQVQQAQKDRSEAVKANSVLRQERDEARQQVMLEEDKQAKTFRESVKTKKQTSHDSLHREEILKLQLQLKHQPSKQDSINEEIKKQQHLITELERENKMLISDKERLKEHVDRVSDDSDRNYELKEKYKQQAESFKTERDKILQQHEELKTRYETLQEDNNVLKNQMLDNNCQMRIMRNEAVSCRPRLTRITNGRTQHVSTQQYQKDAATLQKNFTSYDTSANGQRSDFDPYSSIPECNSPIDTSSSEDEDSHADRPPIGLPPRVSPRTEGHRYPHSQLTGHQNPQPEVGHNLLKRSDGAVLRQTSRDKSSENLDWTKGLQKGTDSGACLTLLRGSCGGKDLVASSVVIARSGCIHTQQACKDNSRDLSPDTKSVVPSYQSCYSFNTTASHTNPTSLTSMSGPKLIVKRTQNFTLLSKPIGRPKLPNPERKDNLHSQAVIQIDSSQPLTNQIAISSCTSKTTNQIDPSQSVTNQMEPLQSVTNQMDPSQSVTNQMDTAQSLTNQMDTAQSLTNQMDPSQSVTNQMDTAQSVTNQMDPSQSVTNQMDTKQSVTNQMDISQSVDKYIGRSVLTPNQQSQSLPTANHHIQPQNISHPIRPQTVSQSIQLHSEVCIPVSSTDQPCSPLYQRRRPSNLPSPSSPDTGPFHRHLVQLSGKKKCPLVVYAPRELYLDLQTHLLGENSFIRCPYDVIDEFKSQDCKQMLIDWIEAGKCIHYTEEQGGVYRCLGTETLRLHMKKEDCGRVLLDVPVEAVQRMYAQKIHAIVLIIKYSDLENRGVLSGEEREIIKMHEDFRPKYEKLVIDHILSMSTIASMIVHKVAAWDTRHSSGVRNCNAAAPPSST